MQNYNCTQIAERIVTACNIKKGKRKIAELLKETSLPLSTIDNIKKGSMPAADKLAIIADGLDCSLDYLLGRTDIMSVNKGKAVDVDVNIGDNSANFNFGFSADDIALLQIIHRFDIVERARIICELSERLNVEK